MMGGIKGKEFRGKYDPHGETLGLSLWDVPTWLEHAQAQTTAGGKKKKGAAEDDHPTVPVKVSRYPLDSFNSDVPSLDMALAKWRVDGLDLNALALVPNAAVVGNGVWKEGEKLMHSKQYVDFAGWKLSAFDRATGKAMWSVDLPGEPIFNGIAPAADGTWVVVLRDGSVAGVRN